MIKDLIDIKKNNIPAHGLDVHIIKKYIIKTAPSDSFVTGNLCMLLIKSGKLKIKSKEVTQDLTARDLFIIPKNSICTLLNPQEKLQLFIISFTSEFAFENSLKKDLIDSLSVLIMNSAMKIQLEEKDYLVLSLIYKLVFYVNKDCKANGIENELKRISFNLFLFELRSIFNKYVSESLMNFTRKQAVAIQFLTMLTIHCRNQHRAKFYAGSLFVTTGYLNKIVKNITGQTVKNLITLAIINEAKSLLESPQLTISEIAEKLDFVNASNFSAFFKKSTCISPSEYRLNAAERHSSC